MTLTEYIKKLQMLEAKGHGECEVIYARDDEGNGYQPVSYEPSRGYFDGEDYDSMNEDANVVCIN